MARPPPSVQWRNAMITRNLVAIALALGTSGLMFAAALA
jgi:hypothetical protein